MNNQEPSIPIWNEFNTRRVIFSHTPDSEKKEFKELKAEADMGIPRAQHEVGNCYEKGIGIQQSHKWALHYYKLAADRGYTPSQTALGQLYEMGLGVEQSFELAFHYYQLAALQNDAQGQLDLARMYSKGQGVEQSEEGLFTFTILLQAKEKGIGTEKSPEQAFNYYKIAAEIARKNEYASPIVELARCYENEIGTQKSPKDAFRYYRLAGEERVVPGLFPSKPSS